MTQNLSLLAAPQVVFTTISGASDDSWYYDHSQFSVKESWENESYQKSLQKILMAIKTTFPVF